MTYIMIKLITNNFKIKCLKIEIAIDGPVASGAGTQAKLISKHYNLFYLNV